MIPSFAYIYSRLCEFSSYLSPDAFQSIPAPPFPGDINLTLFARVSVLTGNHLRRPVSPHFITCLPDLPVIKDSALRGDLCERHLESGEVLGLFAVIERSFYLSKLSRCSPRRQLPHAPENPTAVLSKSEKRAIDLAWAKPFDGNSPLIRYILEVSENSKSSDIQTILGMHPPIVSSSTFGALYPFVSVCSTLRTINYL